MNKFIVSIVGLSLLVGAFGFSSVVSADVCGDATLNHPASEVVDPITFATTTISAVNFATCGNGPINYIMPWGDEATMPRIPKGQFVTDENGFKVWAPSTDYNAGWIDLTHTEYYRNEMRVLVGQLQEKGFMPQFPEFDGWVGK